jgi:hypothetical protein
LIEQLESMAIGLEEMRLREHHHRTPHIAWVPWQALKEN